MNRRLGHLGLALVLAGAALGALGPAASQPVAAAQPDPRIDAVITIPADGPVGIESIGIHAGFLYVAGSVLGTVADESSVGKTDVFVAKLTLDGSLVWARQFGSTEPDFVRDMSVGSTGLLVGGDTLGSFPGFTNPAFPYHDAWVARFDFNGAMAWADQFGAPAHDFVEGTAVGGGGELYATGYGGAGGFIRRYSVANGDVLWERFFVGWNGTFESERIGFPRAIDADEVGPVVTGHISGSLIHRDRSRTDTWIRRFSATGDVLWTTENDPPVIGLEPFSVAIDGFGISLVVERLDDQWLRRYNLAGTLRWEETSYASEIESNCLGVLTAGTDGGRHQDPPAPFSGVASAVDAAGTEQWRQSTVAEGEEEYFYTDIAGDGQRAYAIRQHANYEPEPTVTSYDIVRIVGVTRNGCPPFTDIAGSFEADIVWAWQHRLTGGCSADRFCPGDVVTREQMASFLVRALGLPATTRDFYTDDQSSIHEADINRLAASGITGGCGAARFCPKSVVTREQMASFLARGLGLPPASVDYFADDESSIHEADINRLAAAAITGGCDATSFCPRSPVTRGAMAAFLRRALEP